MKRRSISLRLRYAVFERDGHRCRYCGATADEAKLHIDHMTPVSAGGANDYQNLITACAECNLGKAAYLPLRHIPEQRELALTASIFQLCARRFGEDASHQTFQLILDFVRMEPEPEKIARVADEAESWGQALRAMYRVTGYPPEFWGAPDENH